MAFLSLKMAPLFTVNSSVTVRYVLVVGLLVQLVVSQCELSISGVSQATAEPAIVLVRSERKESQVVAELARILLAGPLGIPTVNVEEENQQSTAMNGIGSGTYGAALDVWPSQASGFAASIAAGSVLNAGALGFVGQHGWFATPACITLYPTAVDIGSMTTLTREAFFGTVANSIWTTASALHDQQIADNNNWNLTAKAVSTTELNSRLSSAITGNTCILVHYWTPADVNYTLQRLALPTYSESCYSTGPMACDYPPEPITKLIRPALATTNPLAYHVLRQLWLGSAEIQAILKNSQKSSLTVSQAACAWLQANPTVWSAWLPMAAKNGKNMTGVIVGSVVGSAVFLAALLVIGGLFVLYRVNRQKNTVIAIEPPVVREDSMKSVQGLPTQTEGVLKLLEALAKKKKLTAEDQSSLMGVRELIAGGSLAHLDKTQLLKVDASTRAYLLKETMRGSTDSLNAQAGPQAPPALNVLSVRNIQTIIQNQGGLYNWNFDAFKFAVECEGSPLRAIGIQILRENALFTEFDLEDDKLNAFLKELEGLYNPNPYHSATHATDVTQALYYLIQVSGVQFTSLELLALYFSALCHDVKHPGLNNNFLVAARDPLALTYNDSSVLENMHCSTAFQLLTRPELNFLCHLTPEQFLDFRRLVVSIILATDLARHTEIMGEYKSATMVGPLDLGKKQHRVLLFQMLIKAADLMNCSRPWGITKEWADHVALEFYAQGEQEKQRGLPLSPFMDREKMPLHKMQSTFNEFIAKPMLKALNATIPIPEPLECLEENHKTWLAMAAQ